MRGDTVPLLYSPATSTVAIEGMTLFLIVAAILVLVALALMLPAIVGDRSDGRSEQLGANVIIARERRVQLDNALATAAIDEQTHQQEVASLERELARELASESETTSATPRLSTGGTLIKWGTAIVIVLFIPVASALLYVSVGDPGAINRDRTPLTAQTAQGGNGAQGSPQGTGAPPLADLLPNLEARLAENPDDVMGWRLLGRSYITVNEFERAASALKRALKLEANDVDTLAQLAEATAMIQGGELAGEPIVYLEKALGLDASHGQTLWLLGMARQQAGEHRESLDLLGRLRSRAESDGNVDAVRAIEQMMNRSREVVGEPLFAADEAAPPPAVPDTNREAPAGGLRIDVQVSLSEAAASDADPETPVFVYARASEGPPMPLAVARLTVADLPTTVTLDETMSMIPNMTLSAFPNVTIGARVSMSGDPVGQSGDWFNEVNDLNLNEENRTAIIINARKP